VERTAFLALVASLSGCERAPAAPPPLPAPPAQDLVPPAPPAPVASASPPMAPAAPAASVTGAPDARASPSETFLSTMPARYACRVRQKRTEGNPHFPLTPMENACLAIAVPPFHADWPACEGVEPWCSMYAEGLAPPLGRRVLSCLQAKGGKRPICDKDVTVTCVDAVTAAATVRPDARTACEAMSAACASKGTGIDDAACGRVLSSLHDCDVLSWVAYCIESRCSVHDCLANPW